MRIGRQEPDTLHGQLHAKVRQAERESEAALVALWRKAAAKDWKAAAGMLGQRFPERWGQKSTVAVEGTVRVKGSDSMESLLTKLAQIAERPSPPELDGDALPALRAAPSSLHGVTVVVDKDSDGEAETVRFSARGAAHPLVGL